MLLSISLTPPRGGDSLFLLLNKYQRGNRKNAERSGKAVEWNGDTRKAMLVRVCRLAVRTRARACIQQNVRMRGVDRVGRSSGSIEGVDQEAVE